MDEPPLNVSAQLLEALNTLESRFRIDHELDVPFAPAADDAPGQDPNQWHFENSLAAELLTVADDLVASPKLRAWREKLSGSFPIGDLARVLADFKLVKPQIRLDLARRDIADLEGKAGRLIDVLSLLLDDPPADRVRAYLQRVSRCYIAGLGPETVVMCRAVLDAAFEDRVPDDLIVRHQPQLSGKAPSLADRITVASKARILSRESATAAREVKAAGNEAIHAVPFTTLRPLEAMRKTAQVLGALAI